MPKLFNISPVDMKVRGKVSEKRNVLKQIPFRPGNRKSLILFHSNWIRKFENKNLGSAEFYFHYL